MKKAKKLKTVKNRKKIQKIKAVYHFSKNNHW